MQHENKIDIEMTGVTEDQFGEKWTKTGSISVGDDGVLVAKSRM